MKFTKIKKTLCFALAMAMLMVFVPMSALAADGDAQLVLEPTADTYIYQSSANRTTNYSEETTMYFRRNGKPEVGRYGAWPMIQFDLAQIQKYLNENKRKEIDTVKMTLYLQSFDNDNNASGTTIAAGNIKYYAASVEPTDYSTLSWSSYAQQLGSTTVADGVYDMVQAPSGMTELGDVTLCPDNTLEDGDAYDFDVSEFVKADDLSGLQSFVLYPYAINHMTGRFYTSEYKETDSTLIPKLTVTFKDKPAPATVQTIGAKADTYIRQASTADGSNAVKNFSGNDSLYFVRNGADNAKNKYASWAMVQFDLDSVEIPEGMVVDTATVTMYLKSYDSASTTSGTQTEERPLEYYAATVEPTDYSTVTWASYAEQLGNTDKMMYGGPEHNGMVSMGDNVTICSNGTFTADTAYNFDVTKGVAGDCKGLQSFVFYSAENYMSGYFHSMEAEDENLRPSLTVTFKEAPAPTLTINPLEMVLALGPKAGEDRCDTENHIYLIRNDASDYRTAAKMMFDLYDVIPENKVVTKAELKINVADTWGTDVRNGLKIVNYKDNEWTRTNTDDETEIGSLVQWTELDDNARLAGDLSVSGVAPIFDSEGKEIHDWVTVDVTEFVSQQINTEECVVSFFVTPNVAEAAFTKIYNAYSGDNAPQLVLTYEDASEQPALTIGTPTFANPYTGEVMTNFVAGSYLYAHVPVSGYSAEGIEGKVILATYFADGSLRYIDEVNDFKFHAGNGTITFALTPQTNAVTTKVFVWDANNKSITPTAGVINVEAAVAE